ncbi:MAG: TauD/TfdA family dioxygenase [Actinomycetota bacterium]
MAWTVTRTARGVELDAAGSTHALSWRWLRDHGEDPESFDHATSQRRIDVLGEAPQPAQSIRMDDERLIMRWPDAPTATWITNTTLVRLLGTSASESCVRPWRRAADLADIDRHSVDAILADDHALTAWMLDLATWGFARLGGFAGGHDEARQISDRIGYVRETIFGGLWDLASDLTDHEDTAYTQTFLAPHTDGTYSHDAPGLQMFCCVERSGTGGESIVVDGLAIAEDLRRDHPGHFELLTRLAIPAHYIEPGVELRAARPALRLAADGGLAQISLNNYDRSPMLLPADEMERFYEAYGTLQRMADDPDRWHAVRLEAGDVLINNNWRVLHGRHAYTGARRFVGCYLNHEDFESRCRTLGITL